MSEPTLTLTDSAESGAASVFADIGEGLAYLSHQPRVMALGFTYACMMAGVISANVLVVALAKDVLFSGPRGYGWIEAGWAFGAIVGGLVAGFAARKKPYGVLIFALGTLAIGHMLFPYARVLILAVAMNALFGVCRALGGVLTQSSIMASVPRQLMGRTQSAFSVIEYDITGKHEFYAGVVCAARYAVHCFSFTGCDLWGRGPGGYTRAYAFGGCRESAGRRGLVVWIVDFFAAEIL